MAQIQASAIAPSYIHADELTESDIIQHNDSILLVVSELEYTNKGIEFEAMWDVVTPDNLQTIYFAPDTRVELVNYQSQPVVVQTAA